MRIQILPLPTVFVGDDMQEPFALIIDQYDGDLNWDRFKDDCGARALYVTPDTVEVVDRYAEPADTGFADREIARLQDYLTTQFPLPKGTPGPDDTPVDVAIDLLTREVLRRDAVEIVDRTGPLLTELRDLTAGWPRIQRDGPKFATPASAPECIGQDRCAGDNCPAHRDMP